MVPTITDELVRLFATALQYGEIKVNPCPLCGSRVTGFAFKVGAAKTIDSDNFVEAGIGCYRHANGEGCDMPFIHTSSPNSVLIELSRIANTPPPDGIEDEGFFIAFIENIVGVWNALTHDSAESVAALRDEKGADGVPSIVAAAMIDGGRTKWAPAIDVWRP